MANQGHRGHVQDPEHDGRLKENREAGRTKGATSGSQARAAEHGHETRYGASHGDGHPGQQAHAQHAGGDDLKSREYRDSSGNVHHHTKTYMDQHKG
jgi:hypothetical protein